MVEIKPEPRKRVYMSVAISPEMKSDLALAAQALKMNGGVSELLRVLAQNFLDGRFDETEIVKSVRNASKKRKAVVRKQVRYPEEA